MPKMTVQTRMVLAAFIRSDNSGVDLYGLQVVEKTGLARGTAYPILNRLEDAGWLVSRREVKRGHPKYTPRHQGGPPRRYYSLTSEGLDVARKEAALARSRSA